MTEEYAFRQIPFPARSSKPRRHGRTMMIDWGLPPGHQRDVVRAAGLYIDHAKLAGSIPKVMPEVLLREKLSIYRSEGIPISSGGLFAELAWMQGNIDPFFAELQRLEFSAVEISDNLLEWTLTEKRACIRKAIEQYSLTVYGEVGKKEGGLNDDAVLADLDVCLDAGCDIVFLEAYELFHDGAIRSALIREIGRRFPMDKLLFELPVVVLPGISREFKHKVLTWLVREFGTEVNLANVEWDEIWLTEIVRRGAAGETSHPGGAYQLTGKVARKA